MLVYLVALSVLFYYSIYIETWTSNLLKFFLMMCLICSIWIHGASAQPLVYSMKVTCMYIISRTILIRYSGKLPILFVFCTVLSELKVFSSLFAAIFLSQNFFSIVHSDTSVTWCVGFFSIIYSFILLNGIEYFYAYKNNSKYLKLILVFERVSLT